MIANWLLDEFDLQGHKIAYTPLELQGGPSLQLSIPNQETPRRAHNMGSFLLGSVCLDCNNGWMSTLEGEAKPDLVRLIMQVEAQPSAPVALARWALKTAYTLSQFLNPPVGRVPRAHGLWPRDHGGLPQGVAVFHRQMPDWKFWFSAPLTFAMDGASSEWLQSRYRSAYRYVVQIGHALFVVQFWPDSVATLVYNSNICQLLLASCTAANEAEPIPEVPGPSAEFELIMATRYETRDDRQPGPADLCLCGSGIELQHCWRGGHQERLVDNWGWM